MVLVDKIPELKYMKIPFKLPFDPKQPMLDHAIFLLIKDSNQAYTMLNNANVIRDAKYARYFKPIVYKTKIFNKNINQRMSQNEVHEMTSFAKTLNMIFINKANVIKNKNVIVDTSIFNTNFINSVEGRTYLTICEKYVELLKNYCTTTCKEINHSKKYIFLNAVNWDISGSNKAKTLSVTSKLLNPFSMLYTLLKKNPEVLHTFDDYTFFFFDGEKGYFKFTTKNIDDKTYLKIFQLIGKFKAAKLILDEESEPTIAEKKNIVIADIEPNKKEIEDMEKDSEEEDEKDTSSIDDLGITEDDIIKATAEINDNHETATKSLARNKRIEELRQKQKEIKIDKVKLGDIIDNKQDYHIKTIDISDKVFTPNEAVKKIRFDNFNKSYVESDTMKKDLINVFTSLSERKTLPVFVRDLTIVDSSTAMDLKETWTIKLEGDDGVRHSVTIDVPKVYDNNFLYLGGNRKHIINQQFLKPLIKIEPDVVQICTNYNKIFMYRYGDDVAPYIVVFRKIIRNNPKYFKITYGNGVALNNGHKTTIEYDSLAKDFLEIEIRGTGKKLVFNQKYFDDLVEAKKLEPIRSDYIYCMVDGIKNGKVNAYVLSLNEDEPNDSEDFDIKHIGGVVSYFAAMFHQATGKDFWELAGPKDKAGKRFMYSRCKVMEKFIPTIVLLSYFEGLSTVLRKAEIQYSFSDTRPRINTNYQGVIQFADGYLIYERLPLEKSLLMNGLTLVDTRAYKFADFDTHGVYLDIFDALYSARNLAVALDSYYDNMIDPITKEVLTTLDLPTELVDLMIAANNLLADNNCSSELSLTEFRVRNLEMISSYLYKLISRAYSGYKATAMRRNPTKISIPKNALIKELLTSNIVEDTSIINPITEKEKNRSITCKGPSGINLERAYTQEKRCFDPSMTGAFGISTSPDGNCGIIREMTVEPKIINQRGFIDCEMQNKDMVANNLFSYAELLTPLGVNYDDPMRTAMATKQS